MVCQTDPFSVTVDQKNNGDWYVLPTLINKRLEVSMTNILLGANYDITLYTRTITDFIYVAHSTYQLNSDETFTYTFTEQMSNPYYFLRVDFKDVRTDQDDRYRLSMRTLPLQDTALSRNTSTYLPHVFNIKSCNGISFSDIPYAQQHLVYINTVCQSQPSATPDDINDWYHIYLNEGQPVTIDVTDMSVGADYDLFLYRLESNGTVALQSPLASSQNKSQESEQVSYIAEATGAYYIQVFLAEKVPHNMQSTYNLLVSTFVK
jgi:hypothetical protein